MSMLWLAGALVSIPAWFLGEWIASAIWPDDALAAFVVACVVSVVAASLAMTMLRMRALSSGRYRKSAWGVRRR